MPQRKPSPKDKKIEKMRIALRRSNTRLLLTAVAVFQFVALLLLAFQGGTFHAQALILAFAVPAVTVSAPTLLAKLFPIDRAIAILALFLCSVGIIILQSASPNPARARTQALYACVGLLAMGLGAWLIRIFRNWKNYTYYLMGACLLALFAPFVIRSGNGNAYNWIRVGGLSVQPSEFMKPLLIVILASGFSNHPRFLRTLPFLAFAAACCGILLLEKDLGALLLFFLTTVLMFYVATSNWLITLSGLLLGSGCAVVAYHMFDYVRKRIAIWINPWSDPLDVGHQLVQSLIAIGSGGLFGTGLGLGMSVKVPLYYSDFIFASIAEEFGLLFSVGLLAIYVLIIMRGLVVAGNTRTSFHSLVAFGIVAMLGLQTMLIVGGNTQLLPLTGVTLPLIAAGGSSLVSTFFSIGILLGISSMNIEDESRDIAVMESEDIRL